MNPTKTLITTVALLFTLFVGGAMAIGLLFLQHASGHFA